MGTTSESSEDSPALGGTPHGLSWEEYVDWLVETHGSLAAVAERLATVRAFSDDVASIERALRRLRRRGHLAGGAWGARALAVFGVPGVAAARAAWMGQYHSRFVDLPLAFALDLVRLWDRPPVQEAPGARTWLALAHATCALRRADLPEASTHLRRARVSIAGAPAEARAELGLVEAFVASREAPERVGPLLLEAAEHIEAVASTHDRACLHARAVDQTAYAILHGPGDRAPLLTQAVALYDALPSEGPPFALHRRASGLAYARWKLGAPDHAAELAREACRQAGDGGHLRLRAMALAMLARILPRTSPEGQRAHARALAIVATLEDEALRLRFRPRVPAP